MNIHQLGDAAKALDNRDRLDDDDVGFIRHLFDNKDVDLTKAEVRWLQDVMDQLKGDE